MSETLLSSADLSDMSDIMDDVIIITPKCPVCRMHYSVRIKPVVFQPCGHGSCRGCFNELSSRVAITDGVPDDPKCPICRDAIIHTTPNFSLREITSNVNNDHNTGYWEKQITNIDKLRGMRIHFSRKLRAYSKVICIRIAYDDIIIKIKFQPKDWNADECDAIQRIKNALIRSLNKTGDEIDILYRWIGILAFPIAVENYLLKFFLQWYDNKEFLESIDGLWLMDVITHPV